MRIPALLAGLALATSALAGCGGGDGEDSGATDTETYCAEVKADKKLLEGIRGGDPDPGFIADAISKIHKLADTAPTEVASDWDVVDATVSDIERTLAEAGITDEDLEGLAKGKPPKGVDLTVVGKLLPKVQELNSQKVQDALDSIRTHAETECGVTLDAG